NQASCRERLSVVKTLERHRYALCEKHVIVPFCCSYQVYRYLAGCFGLISCRHYLELVHVKTRENFNSPERDRYNAILSIEKKIVRHIKSGMMVDSQGEYLNHNNYAFTLQRETMLPPIDPGIAYVEKSIYANGAFASEK